MGEESRHKTYSDEQRRAKTPPQNSSFDDSTRSEKEIPAIRHVGPTLESDPEYNSITTQGYATPEAQIAAEAGQVDPDQRRMEEDDFDSLSGRAFEERPERLKTRLPGDTSSDPHSDLGPDNTTNLQNRRDSDETNRA